MKLLLTAKPSWLARKLVLSVTLATMSFTSVLAEAQMRGPGGRGGGGPGGGHAPGAGRGPGAGSPSRPEPYRPPGGGGGERRDDRNGRGENRGGDRGDNRGGGRGNGPSRPSEPSRPNRPSEPSRPDRPSRPDVPSRPSEPSRPNRPSEPSRPERPNRPDFPSRPSEPSRPDRPNRPDFPSRPSEPSRPNRPSEPSRPDRPHRPDVPSRPDNHGPGRYQRDHGSAIERRREEMRRDRGNRGDSFRRDRDNRRYERNAWNNRFRVNRPERRPDYRDWNRWEPRYNVWWTGVRRPVYYSPVERIHWHRPMPAPGAWRYSQLEEISENLEFLSRDIYDTMDRVALQNEYGLRLRRVLIGLIDATENFNDSINDRYDWYDTLSDLFYLEAQVDLAEQTLSGYSQEWRVQEEMRSLRYYVNELLWTYRQNF